MRRILSLFGGAVAIFALAGTALAVGPTSQTQSGGLHFASGPDATVNSSGSLVVTGAVAGAGTQASGTLTYDVTITTGCINPGSKDQQPSGLQSTTSSVDQQFPLNPTRQGRASFTLTSAVPTTGGRECPRPMRATVVSVVYTDVSLNITSQTGTVSAHWDSVS